MNFMRNHPTEASNHNLYSLYSNPLPSTRTGPLYNAFSYPTKISPEAIALFIASHTKPGETILDTFGGSGTTGLATILCANPPQYLKELAQKYEIPVIWGPRKAVIYEISVLGSFVSRTLCNPPSPAYFLKTAKRWLDDCEKNIGNVYRASANDGIDGTIRHAIWSDIIKCPACHLETSFWELAVSFSPLKINSNVLCPKCNNSFVVENAERVYETIIDPLLSESMIQRKRKLVRIYGKTGKKNWSRPARLEDEIAFQKILLQPLPKSIPVAKIPWGDLYRSGYHKGITHAHHFYTYRNLLVMGTLWEAISQQPAQVQDALKMLALSYNSAHSTLMTRVVIKDNEDNFVITGAQSGVLYISSLPIEKNIFEGLRRKAANLAKAFELTYGSTSQIDIRQDSSTSLDLADQSIDYIFTDPPFGDYIPYSELNFLNEIWLGTITNQRDEIIISHAQKKTVAVYQRLMTKVFSEIARVLKDEGKATIVFHSAKPAVWEALQHAYSEAGMSLIFSSVLDKVQGSFKQVTSKVSVKGDPLLLLTKEHRKPPESNFNGPSIEVIISHLWETAKQASDTKEQTVERLYSRFVNYHLQNRLQVPLEAQEFYKLTRALMEAE